MAAYRFFTVAVWFATTGGILWGQGTEYPALKYRSNYLASYYLSNAPNPTPW